MLRVGGGCLLSICGLRVLPARGCCWGQQDDGASGPAHQPISVPTVTPQRDPSQKGGLPKPDLLERQGLMPMDRCGDWAGLRQLFQRSLARPGRPPPTMKKAAHFPPGAQGTWGMFPLQIPVHINHPVSIPRTSGLSPPTHHCPAPSPPAFCSPRPQRQAWAHGREGEEGAPREAWQGGSLCIWG